MIKNLICIQCPRGCHLEVDTETLEVKGNFCPRGKAYGQSEISAPKRTITSTVKVLHGDIRRCSVRTSGPVDKAKMFHVMKEIDKIELVAPVEMNQVIIRNVLGTGVDVISTKKLERVD